MRRGGVGLEETGRTREGRRGPLIREAANEGGQSHEINAGLFSLDSQALRDGTENITLGRRKGERCDKLPERAGVGPPGGEGDGRF